MLPKQKVQFPWRTSAVPSAEDIASELRGAGLSAQAGEGKASSLTGSHCSTEISTTGGGEASSADGSEGASLQPARPGNTYSHWSTERSIDKLTDRP